jgi:phosphohistidine phosphatase SixA
VRLIRLAIVGLVLIMLPIGPARAEDIWSQLRDERGLVVLMRHAIAPGGGDPAGFRLGDCSTQRNLSADGRKQARAIGQQFREKRIPISGVRSSRWCRASQTAQLLDLGPVRQTAALDSVFTASNEVARVRQRQAERLIDQHRGRTGVLVLVGHQANIIDLTGIAPASGGAVVVRADQRGVVKVVGQIPPPVR